LRGGCLPLYVTFISARMSSRGLGKSWLAPGEYVPSGSFDYTSTACSSVKTFRPGRGRTLRCRWIVVTTNNEDMMCWRLSRPDLVWYLTLNSWIVPLEFRSRISSKCFLLFFGSTVISRLGLVTLQETEHTLQRMVFGKISNSELNSLWFGLIQWRFYGGGANRALAPPKLDLAPQSLRANWVTNCIIWLPQYN